MNQGLKAQIHRYAENREIDYMSAKNLGIAYGIKFKDEKDLIEFKQLVDRYLKTFNESAFYEIEKVCNIEESYEYESPAVDDSKLHPTKPTTKKIGKKKKTVKESYEYESPAVDDSKLHPTKPTTKKIGKKKKTVKESKTLDDMFKI